MRYAQIAAGKKLHLVYEPGEGRDAAHLVPAGRLSLPLCNKPVVGGYRMTINVPLGHACRNCQRVHSARSRRASDTPREKMEEDYRC